MHRMSPSSVRKSNEESLLMTPPPCIEDGSAHQLPFPNARPSCAATAHAGFPQSNFEGSVPSTPSWCANCASGESGFRRRMFGKDRTTNFEYAERRNDSHFAWKYELQAFVRS